MRVALVQYDIAWEDKITNHRRIEAMLAAADLPPGTFVLLPELGDTGFSFDLDTIIDDRSLAWGAEVAARLGCWLQVGHARRGPDGLGRNCATIIGPDGSVAGTYEKIHPFSYGKESRYYGGGDRVVLRGCGAATICPLICYDLRFPELWRHATVAGAEVFTIGASWPAARAAHWRTLLIARAIENQAFVVGLNRTGRDPVLEYAGGSLVVSPKGEILAEAASEEVVLVADLDLGALAAWRGEFPALHDLRRKLLGIDDCTPAGPILTDHNGRANRGGPPPGS